MLLVYVVSTSIHTCTLSKAGVTHYYKQTQTMHCNQFLPSQLDKYLDWLPGTSNSRWQNQLPKKILGHAYYQIKGFYMANMAELEHSKQKDKAVHFISDCAQIPHDMKCSDCTQVKVASPGQLFYLQKQKPQVQVIEVKT